MVLVKCQRHKSIPLRLLEGDMPGSIHVNYFLKSLLSKV